MANEPSAPNVRRNELDGADTVTVYCRLPHGIQLQRQEKVSYMEQTPNGAREAHRFVPVGEPFKIEGNAMGRGLDSEKTALKRIIAGFAVTENVPADLWRAFVEQRKGLDALTRRDIYAVAKPSDNDAKRSEASAVPTGLEPIDPAKMKKDFPQVERSAA